MSESQPIVELIAENLFDTLEAATTIDAAGDSASLLPVRPTRMNWEGHVSVVDLRVVLVQLDPEEDEDPTLAHNASDMRAWVQPFALVVYILDSDKATTPIDRRINTVEADIAKALMAAPTRGGYAVDTIVQPSERFLDDAGASGITIVVNVPYRTDLTDPYTKR